MQVLKAIHCYR